MVVSWLASRAHSIAKNQWCVAPLWNLGSYYFFDTVYRACDDDGGTWSIEKSVAFHVWKCEVIYLYDDMAVAKT